MDYIHDVFISYKRGGTKDIWLEKNFLPLFSEYLEDKLLRIPDIFVDKTGLIQGADWTEGIIHALSHSRSLVAIISPSYFMGSEWCIKEFITMKYRQIKLNLKAGTIPPSLMWLLAVQDFESAPPIIHTIQYADYIRYNVIGDAFFRSDDFLTFQKDLRKDVNTVYNIIKNAPVWREEWDSEAWKSDILRVIKAYFENPHDPKQEFLSW